MGFFANIYSFLAPQKLPHHGIMVVEGWIHDFALDDAVSIYHLGEYSKIICTGVPVETGSYIQAFKSYPEMTRARLVKMGIPTEQIIVAVAEDQKKDRTYISAVALRAAFIAHNLKEKNIHLMTTGPHGRRSRMLFQQALGKEYHVGVTSLDPASYNAENWHTCSEGVRSVVSEALAYLYAKLLFRSH